MSVRFLNPLVKKERIERAQYASLPPHIQPFAKNHNHIHRVTITPQKTADSGHARVTILAPNNWRTGNMLLINDGRVPRAKSPSDLEDMRPCVFYTFGVGTQKFRPTLQANRNNWIEVVVEFE